MKVPFSIIKIIRMMDFIELVFCEKGLQLLKHQGAGTICLHRMLIRGKQLNSFL